MNCGMEIRVQDQVENPQEIGYGLRKGHPVKEECEWYKHFFCRAPIIQQSTVQKKITLSVTEAELNAPTSMAQDMMYVKCLLESI